MQSVRWRFWFPYLLLGTVTSVVIVSNLPTGGDAAPGRAADVLICPPCGMAVEPDADLSVEVDGRTIHFCSTRCRTAFSSGQAEKIRTDVAA
ncbi:MAG: hypothetical protein ACE5EX_12435, partial [Phycisphaerae bacterium]